MIEPLIFVLGITSVFSAPMTNSTEDTLKDIQHQLLNPHLNSVLDREDAESEQAPITKDIFPDRQGFVTGHRIPLELFSKETIQRLKPVSIFDREC